MRQAFDWPGLLQAGLRGLGLTPDQFWRLTPLELRIMLGADAAPSALTRSRLDELCRAFPDVTKEAGHDRADRHAGGSDRGAGGDAGGHGQRGECL